MKHMNLNLSEPARLQKVAHALSNELRLKILALLDECSMNVLELSQRLDMPVSTVSNSIVVLEEADLIRTERQSGVRGVSKLCSRKKDNISIQLANMARRELESFFFNMPIGAYSDCVINPTCGMETERLVFRVREGYVEYRFSSQVLMEHEAKCLALSFEACSEAPNYRKDWPSDITVSINGVELGTWCCPGDFGGRQGRFPEGSRR